MIAALGLQALADLAADGAHVAEVEAAVRLGGRAHADERDVGREERGGRVRPGAQPAGRDGRRDELLEPLLDDGRAAGVDEPDLGRVRIDADDVVPVACEARGRDRADLRLGAELGVDFVGVSYVRSADDLILVRGLLAELERDTPLVAKIETELALANLDRVLAHCDAVMVARGDLSLEIPFERVPMAQKRIVQAAIRAGRPAITATQMLQSMVTAPRPTRAEITDVANAVLDGTDAVMLSDETAIGVDPVRVCRAMSRIIDATEAAYPTRPETPLEGVSGDDYDTLRDVIVDAGALLYRLAPARHSLADVFSRETVEPSEAEATP